MRTGIVLEIPECLELMLSVLYILQYFEEHILSEPEIGAKLLMDHHVRNLGNIAFFTTYNGFVGIGLEDWK